MAIDPPYRLDPFQNIINIHFHDESTEGTGGPPEFISSDALFGVYAAAGGGSPFYISPPGFNNSGANEFYEIPGDSIHGMTGWITGTPNSLPGTGWGPPGSGDFFGVPSGTAVSWTVIAPLQFGGDLIWGPWVADFSDYQIHTKAVGHYIYTIYSIEVGPMFFYGGMFEYAKAMTLTFQHTGSW